MRRPSDAYRKAVAEATEHHAGSKTYSGKFLRPHKPWLLELIAQRGIMSALDYGCGKGAQYTWVDPADGKTLEESFGFPVRKYDPAWPPFAEEPAGNYDLVICTHVLGSIPISDLDWVLARIFSTANKAVYLAEKIGPVGKQALSAPETRPVGWTKKQWMMAVTPYANRFSGAVIFSFRDPRNHGGRVITRRHAFGEGAWTQLA